GAAEEAARDQALGLLGRRRVERRGDRRLPVDDDQLVVVVPDRALADVPAVVLGVDAPEGDRLVGVGQTEPADPLAQLEGGLGAGGEGRGGREAGRLGVAQGEGPVAVGLLVGQVRMHASLSPRTGRLRRRRLPARARGGETTALAPCALTLRGGPSST